MEVQQRSAQMFFESPERQRDISSSMMNNTAKSEDRHKLHKQKNKMET